MTTAVASPSLQQQLDEPYPLTPEHIKRFREDGYIKLKNVFSAEVLDYYGEEISRITAEKNRFKDTPLEQRGTYGKAFIQVMNLWRESDLARAFSFSKRLARIATELMGTKGVRMFHDQALYKEPGGGFTPWHVDQQYWPLSTGRSVTVWCPLQAVSMEMGPLEFGKGSHIKNIARDISISDESERIIHEAVKEHGLIKIVEPFDLGEVSYHLGWTLHRAGPNTTTQPRRVHTVIYIDRDMRLAQPKNLNQQRDWEFTSPSTKIGEIMADPLNPILYQREENNEPSGLGAIE